MAIFKKPYELSIWSEEINANGIKTEKKGAIIGAHNMNYQGRATQVKLQREIKGTNTLTFQLPTKFFDSEKGEYVKNEFCDYIFNEQKIKLFYDNEWYEFYVKTVNETKNFKSIMINVTCKDSFIDELSRTGYEIEFSTDLYNNVDEIGVFSEIILDDSIWDYRPDLNVGDFTEFTEERFYKIPLSQFGGSIIGYPINLEVKTTDLNENSDYYKDKDFNNLNLQDEITVKNIFDNTHRTLQYGDDLSRVKGIFWDNYYKDNGQDLLNNKNIVTIKSDYIYVPLSQLSTIMGSIYTNSYKAIEEPAIYGHYTENKPDGEFGFALQPNSQNPEDLIQFMCFQDKDIVKFDEVNTIINNDCHYVIKISQWNELLKKHLQNDDNGVIYWTSPNYIHDNSYELSKKYNIKYSKDGGTVYTYGVMPSTKTVDSFYWFPVYYDGYLTNINDTETNLARNISITNRTELNINQNTYVNVYKQKDVDFKGLYSEKELDDIVGTDQEFRICSKNSSKVILPTLARNLVENGSKITDTNGWEAKTQNNNESNLGTGSYYKLLELNVKSTMSNSIDSNIDDNFNGTQTDENIQDYYLEILSPYIEKSDDINYEGQIESDYILNFGFQGQGKKIEKDKVYAIRMISGSNVVDNYILNYRGTNAINNNITVYTIEEKNKYTNMIKDFQYIINQLISSNPDEKYKEVVEEFKQIKIPEKFETDTATQLDNIMLNILKKIANIYDQDKIETYEKLNNFIIYPSETIDVSNSDIIYLKYNWLIYNGKTDYDIQQLQSSNSFFKSKKLSNTIITELINSYITENSRFEKHNNIDLDKIVIGKGSVNLQGNYIVDGIDNNNGDFISFKDLFEEQNNSLNFIPEKVKENDKEFLYNSLYHTKENGIWYWKNQKDNENKYCIEDNAFLLFKAKETIENPYLAIRVESKPAVTEFSSIEEGNYQRNNGQGIKMQIITPDGEIGVDVTELLKEGYLFVDDCLIEIYSVDEKTFSQEFLNSIGFDSTNGTVSIKKSEDSNRNYGELKDEDLLSSAPDWQSNSSTEESLYYNVVGIKDENGVKSYAYALFINKIYYGIFWMEKDYIEPEQDNDNSDEQQN